MFEESEILKISDEQIMESKVISEITGFGFIVTNKVSVFGVQGKPGSFVVKMIFTPPFVMSDEPGVYVVLSDVAEEKVPLPEVVHVPVVADPPTVPESDTVCP